MTAQQAPPPGSLVRDSETGSIWSSCDGVRWQTENGLGAVLLWEELSSGRFGELELLVPVPLDPTTGTGPVGVDLAQKLVEGVLNPVGAMMLQLAQAAGGAVTSCVTHAYRLGQQEPNEYAAMVAAMRSVQGDTQQQAKARLCDALEGHGIVGADAITAIERYLRDPLTDAEVRDLAAIGELPGDQYERGRRLRNRYGVDVHRVAVIDYNLRVRGGE